MKNPVSLLDKSTEMKRFLKGNTELDLIGYLSPETELERAILSDEAFREGLFWGEPRYGHPEGKVVYHIREVLDNVDKIDTSPSMRASLRIITFVHDSFKHKEEKDKFPRDWSKHHGVFARKFLEKFTKDQALLEIVELHDEAFYCWRMAHQYNRAKESAQRLEYLLGRIGDNMQLYYLFFKCDTRTGDKNQAPLRWFEKTIQNIKLVDF